MKGRGVQDYGILRAWGVMHFGIYEGKGGLKHGSRLWLGVDILWNCSFKCMNGMTLTNLSSRFIRRGTISSSSTHNANELHVPHYKTPTGQGRFLYRAVTIWNNLPSDIKLCFSTNILKRRLKNHLLMSGF